MSGSRNFVLGRVVRGILLVILQFKFKELKFSRTPLSPGLRRSTDIVTILSLICFWTPSIKLSSVVCLHCKNHASRSAGEFHIFIWYFIFGGLLVCFRESLTQVMALIMCKKKKKRKKFIGPKLAQVFERRINCNIFTRKKL